MTIDPVASSAAQAVAGSTGPAPAVSQTEFLQLFVAQLQHQDPLSPLEPNELTAPIRRPLCDDHGLSSVGISIGSTLHGI